MRITHSKAIISAPVVVLCCLIVLGCATTKRIADDIVGNSERLRKKIAVLPVLNRTGHKGDDLKKAAVSELKAYLRRSCEGLLVVETGNISSLLTEGLRLPSGRLDTLALSAIGRTHGLNAVIEETLYNVECLTKKTGIWGFRKPCLILQLAVRVRAYDIETGATILDRVEKGAIELSESEEAPEQISSSVSYDNESILRLLSELTTKIGERICHSFNEEPWKGYITAVPNNTFTLQSGKDVGLATEDVLEVFGLGQSLAGQDGQVYFISGPRIGEIKITKVGKDRSQAVGIKGSNLERSSCVKLKP